MSLDCIKWYGAINSSGYGVTWYKNKIEYAHRVVAGATKDEVVLHTCDNKWCVNPDHLKIGTPADNSQDMKNKNRQAVGERCGNSKLKQEDVLKIRNLQNYFSSREVAAMFNISKTNVLDIWRRHIWRHI